MRNKYLAYEFICKVAYATFNGPRQAACRDYFKIVKSLFAHETLWNVEVTLPFVLFDHSRHTAYRAGLLQSWHENSHKQNRMVLRGIFLKMKGSYICNLYVNVPYDLWQLGWVRDQDFFIVSLYSSWHFCNIRLMYPFHGEKRLHKSKHLVSNILLDERLWK